MHPRRELDGVGTKKHMADMLKKSDQWPKMLEIQAKINFQLARVSKYGREFDRDLHKSLPAIIDEAWCECFRKATVNFCSCT